jgi:ribosomal protein S18 acetylase RimI-like enzyme
MIVHHIPPILSKMVAHHVIVDGLGAGRADAQTLVFEYMAATQAEAGRPVPAAISELPDVLRQECENLALVYRKPGTLLVGYVAGRPAGCVGLICNPEHGPAGTAEVKRLYVRPDYRRDGLARALMLELHQHAAREGMSRLVLDVLPSRMHVIAFYRRLGYQVYQAGPMSPTSMVDMSRQLAAGG